MSTTAVEQQRQDSSKPLSAAEEERIDRALIDSSTKGPVLTLYAAALIWLLIGTVAGLVAAIKMHWPTLWDEWAFLTWGRLRMVHLNTVIYGWASLAGLGTAAWLMARLCRVELQAKVLLYTGAGLWNLGLILGTAGLLAGHGSSVEWLEFPSYAWPLLVVAYAIVAVWVVVMFRLRQPGHVYVTQWYLIMALFAFPWLYGVANVMIFVMPVQGVVQAATNWWFGHNVIGLWFTAIGVGAAYYMIPKVIGRPVHSYYLSALGFWSLALFYSWNGMHHVIGGPFPAWIITASVVASVMMIVPVLTVAINHHMTMKGHFHMLHYSPTLRFVVFGAMAYTVVSVQGITMSFRSLNQITHFTHYTIGHSHLGLYAFFTMVMFGSMYYIVPRLVGREWPSATLIKIHFWTAAYGIGMMVFALTIGGWLQGLQLNDPNIGFSSVVEATLPWMRARSLSGFLLLIAHVVFAYHFALILIGAGRSSGGPTYLAPVEERKEVSA